MKFHACTVTHNTAGKDGGGLDLCNQAKVIMYSSEVSWNKAESEAGGGFYLKNTAYVLFLNRRDEMTRFRRTALTKASFVPL